MLEGNISHFVAIRFRAECESNDTSRFILPYNDSRIGKDVLGRRPDVRKSALNENRSLQLTRDTREAKILRLGKPTTQKASSR